MPHRPDVSQRRPDPRFDRYRQRVGRLLRGDAEVGLLLVEVEPWYEQVGGHLWWTRWSPVYEVLWEHAVVDGDYSNALVPEDASEDQLRCYDEGRYDHYGEDLLVVWTDHEESGRLRASAFGR